MSKPSLELFISKGILPENLPPVFNTFEIWDALKPLGSQYQINNKTVGEHSLYNASKRSGQRRIFGIPHPLFIRDKAIFIEKNWEKIFKTINYSNGSVSKPEFRDRSARHVQITPHSDLPRIRLKAFSKYKYCLVTDVSRFFPSIYTHSIPWATSGKSAAKVDTNPASPDVYGNRLDLILRQSQSRQTVGIPVGPDTSKIISELIMSAVDALFEKRSSPLKPVYIRHVDDFWVGGSTIEECEKHLQNLRLALRAFELDINENKTKIISTKYIFSEDWPIDFDKDIIEAFDSEKFIAKKALSTLSKVVDLATSSGDDGIIRHIIRKIDTNHLWSEDWDLLQHFLAQCAVQFPHSFDYVARVIAWRNRVWLDVDKGLWGDVASSIVDQNSSIGRDAEVTWALWLLKELNIDLSKRNTDGIVENTNALTLAFLAHFYARKKVKDRTVRQKLWDVVSGCPYAGAYWPLTLEMRHLGIWNSSWSSNAPEILHLLHNEKVSIIDWYARPKVFSINGGDDEDDPESAIEDYGADYGSESGEDGKNDENNAFDDL